MKPWYIVFWGLLALGFVNLNIAKKQQLLKTGEHLLLELAPVDPRSLMQGDYMVLDYALLQDGRQQLPSHDGKLVVKRDAKGIASWQRLDDGSPLAPDCFLLKYKRREEGLWLGAHAYFFEEGHADDFAEAAYGDLVVDDAGNSILVGLRNKELLPLPNQTPKPQ